MNFLKVMSISFLVVLSTYSFPVDAKVVTGTGRSESIINKNVAMDMDTFLKSVCHNACKEAEALATQRCKHGAKHFRTAVTSSGIAAYGNSDWRVACRAETTAECKFF